MSTPNLEILAYEETPLGPLCLRRRPAPSSPDGSVVEITLNHEFLMSSLHTTSERALAEQAVALHGGRQLDVWIGGLGLGYTAAAALECTQVATVHVVELLPEVVHWMHDGLLPLSGRLCGDARFAVEQGDAYAQLATTPARQWDLILIDVDHSPDERLDGSNVSFYTAAGLRAARAHLREGGVVGVWSYAEHSGFASALHDVFDEVRVEPVTFRNVHIGEEQTDWLFFARSTAIL